MKVNKRLLKAIQKSPQIVQDYVHEIETLDLALVVRELFILRQQRDALIVLYREIKKEVGEAIK